MARRSLRTVLTFILGASLAGCGGNGIASVPGIFNPQSTIAGPTGASVSNAVSVRRTASADQSIAGVSSNGVAIDAGGASAGSDWSADTDYSGGATSTSTSTVDTSRVTNPAPQAIYLTQRYGSAFSYAIPALSANTTYTVRLHFAETYFTSAGARVFNVTINGKQVLTNFDIFKAAGGANVAVIEPFSVDAGSTGIVSISFQSVVNYPSLAGIEVTSPSGVKTGPSGYPVYSSRFTGNTPFHHTVAQLMAAGATVRSSTVAKNFWDQGFDDLQPSSQTGGEGPIYTVKSGDPGYKFGCPAYGSCNATGMVVHYPTGAYPETGSDHHITSYDPVYSNGEVDGWGGDGNSKQACALDGGSPGSQTCSWGGFYPFSGSGLATGYSSSDAGGYAQGLMVITAQELLQGHIDHALGMDSSCLDNGGVYPAIAGRTTDAACPGNLEPNARYGDLIHLKSSVNVGALGYSQYCAVVVQALQTYGAYTADTNGSWGDALDIEYMNNYTGTNPWYQTIFPSMIAGNDGSGSPTKFSFKSCLNRIPASDIEVIEISAKLPT